MTDYRHELCLLSWSIVCANDVCDLWLNQLLNIKVESASRFKKKA